MALISRGNNFLVPNSSTNPTTLSFTGGSTPPSNAATVGFYTISNGVPSTTPSSTVCPGVQYALRVWINGNSTTATQFLVPTTSSNVFGISTTSTPTNPVLFMTSTINVTLGTGITGVLTSSGTQMSNNFLFTGSDFYANVGYTSPLPMVLSNCTICGGVPVGSTCNSLGLIVPSTTTTTPVNPCLNVTTCGGQCNGSCTTGTCVQQSNGMYMCVTQFSPIIWIVLAIVLIIVIVIAAYLFSRYSTSTPSTSVLVPEPVPMAPVCSQPIVYNPTVYPTGTIVYGPPPAK